MKETYYVDRCKHIIQRNGFYNCIDQPTRVILNSCAIIDYVISNQTDDRKCVVLKSPRSTDHFIVSTYRVVLKSNMKLKI